MQHSALMLGTLVALTTFARSQSGTTTVSSVRVDQAGYPAGQLKEAILVGDVAAATATVRDNVSGRAVLTVPVGPPSTDPQTGDTVRIVDFSSLRSLGRYVLDVAGAGASDPFQLREDVYARPLYLAMRSFYGQRCGMAVDMGPEFAGYRHAACHLDDARFHPSSGRSGHVRTVGGWHDAGDYGKYIVNSGISTGELLWAYEWYPDVWRNLRLDIPESGNRVPDMLDEIRWNIDWMLTMQDADGGVWPKLTSERFGSFVMPEHDDGGPRFVIGSGNDPFKSSCATGDLAAVTAIAARVYKPFDAAYAARSLDASRRAFVWVEAHPNVAFRNPSGVSTGEYGDDNCTDERLWAAAELFRTTGAGEYERVARQLAASVEVAAIHPQNWNSVANLGLLAYADAASGADRPTQDRIRQQTNAAARTIAARTRAAGWRHSLTMPDFVWGSNGEVANYGVLLLAAHRWQPASELMTAALDNLHYLLGRNTFGLSWLTAVGEHPFAHPHHRPSGADTNALPWPGLLSGGPNRNGGDPLVAKLPSTPPARRYLDEEGAYSANEIAINWNAPLVLLLAGVQTAR
jgi:endoglucanase